MKKNILIVDDEELIVENMQYLLENSADKVFTALNGKQALEVLNTEDIQCVISDIHMPIMNGIEFIKQVRANGNEIPFIFFTAHGNNDLMLEAVKYGAFDFLDKPNFNGLEEIIKRGFEKGFSLSQSGPSEEVDTEAIASEYQEMLNLRKK